MNYFKVIELSTFADSKGMLTVLEKALPFDIRRIYWIYGADGETRGGHRHRKSRQALVAVKGEVKIYLNNGINEAHVNLINPHECLIVEPEDWHTMTFSAGSVLVVFASTLYDPQDYIDEPY